MGLNELIENPADDSSQIQEEYDKKVAKKKARRPDHFPDPDPEDLEYQEYIKFQDKLETLDRAQDVFREMAPDAAKAICHEMKFAQKSADRQRAAERILDQELGKPVNRQVNLSLSVSDKSDQELKSDIISLLTETGLVEKKTKGNPLIIDEGIDVTPTSNFIESDNDGEDSATRNGEAMGSSPGTEAAERQESVEGLSAEPGIPDEVLQEQEEDSSGLGW